LELAGDLEGLKGLWRHLALAPFETSFIPLLVEKILHLLLLNFKYLISMVASFQGFRAFIVLI
jgi:hypothetical protein